jgi:Cytochrome P460
MKRVMVVLTVAWSLAFAWAVGGQQAPADGPRYTKGTNLIRPTDYREWIFVSSGIGMTYDPSTRSPAAPQAFSNVFVNPSSYRSFMQTGTWPDKTMFVLEFRNSGSEASINQAGRFQTDIRRLEAEVKDSQFPGGWGFFNFGTDETAEPLSGERVAPCIDCHTKHAAVEMTFVQFYPTLLEVARQKGTLKPGL